MVHWHTQGTSQCTYKIHTAQGNVLVRYTRHQAMYLQVRCTRKGAALSFYSWQNLRKAYLWTLSCRTTRLTCDRDMFNNQTRGSDAEGSSIYYNPCVNFFNMPTCRGHRRFQSVPHMSRHPCDTLETNHSADFSVLYTAHCRQRDTVVFDTSITSN